VMLVVDIRRQSPQEVEESVRVLREAAVDIVGVVVNRTSRDVPRVQTRRAQPSRRAETDAPAPISSAPGQARESGVSAGAEGDAPTSPAIEGSSGGA
jgi:hypothetical protein